MSEMHNALLLLTLGSIFSDIHVSVFLMNEGNSLSVALERDADLQAALQESREYAGGADPKSALKYITTAVEGAAHQSHALRVYVKDDYHGVLSEVEKLLRDPDIGGVSTRE